MNMIRCKDINMIKIFNVFFIAISLHLAAGTMEFVAKKQTNVLFNVKDYGLTQMYFDIIGHRILLKVNPKLIDKNFDIKINNHEILRIEKRKVEVCPHSPTEKNKMQALCTPRRVQGVLP